MNRWSILLALAAGSASTLAAQDTAQVAPRLQPAATLSLAEALQQARANSPTYRQTLNDAGPARWQVREAYGAFLPTASASAGAGYTATGRNSLGGVVFQSQSTPSYLTSSYDLSLQMQLNGRTFTGPGQAKALQRATEADIANAGSNLTFDVTTQYLQALQSGAQTEVARQNVQRNQDFLKFAQARYQVGQATLLDVKKAEADLGSAQVQLLGAVQTENEAKLELLRRMGVVPPVSVDRLALVDTFPVTAPAFQLDQLLQTASVQNPELNALKAREGAAGAALTAAKSEYLPTLSLQAGWSGFTQQFRDEAGLLNNTLLGAQGAYQACLDNNAIRASAGLPTTPDCLAASGLANPTTLDPAYVQNVRTGNNVFPFHYTSQPFRANLTLSLPIFTGFSRSLRIAQARAQQEDAAEGVRARALQLRTDIEARYLGLGSAYETIQVQDKSRAAAREQLRLAQDRYRLGSGTSLELSDAQNAVARAEGDYVNAVYNYHKALAALEAAVGRPLR